MAKQFSYAGNVLIKEQGYQTPLGQFAKSAIGDATWTEFAEHFFSLAAQTSDYQIPFGGVSTAKAVIIEADADVSFKVEGTGNVSIPCEGFMILWDTTITSIYVSNSHATAARNIRVILIGN